MNGDTRLRGGRLRSETTEPAAPPDDDRQSATAPGAAPVVAGNQAASSGPATAELTSPATERPTTPPGATTSTSRTAEYRAPAPTLTPAALQAGRPVAHRRLMRIPGSSPMAPIVGWLTAWGAAALAWSCLTAAGVDLGLGLGLANGQGVVEDRAWPGIWLLIVQAGAFVIGGFAAARMARGNGMVHAALAWVVAMLATGADAIVQTVRDTGRSPLGQIGIPFWVETGLAVDGWLVLALAIFALGSLAGALLGGLLGTAANRAAVREVREVRQPAMAGR
jgi:hypothetical protein